MCAHACQALLNEQLRDDIAAESTGAGRIGKLFVEWAPYFKMYAQFVDTYELAAKELEALLARVRWASCVMCVGVCGCGWVPGGHW